MSNPDQSSGRTIEGLGLIDTGASVSAFDIEHTSELGLPVADLGEMSSVSHIVSGVPIFAGTLVIPGLGVFEMERAVGARLNLAFSNQQIFGEPNLPVIALIGRDILSECVLVYHGAEGFVSLSR